MTGQKQWALQLNSCLPASQVIFSKNPCDHGAVRFPAWRRPMISSRILPKPGEAAVQYHVVFSAGDWESFFFLEHVLTVPTGDISDFVLEPQISIFFLFVWEWIGTPHSNTCNCQKNFDWHGLPRPTTVKMRQILIMAGHRHPRGGVPSPWSSVANGRPIGGFGQLGAQGTRWGASVVIEPRYISKSHHQLKTGGFWTNVNQMRQRQQHMLRLSTSTYSRATDDTWRCRFFWGWVAWFWTKFAKLILTGTWHTCQVLPALKKLLLQGALDDFHWWLGDGWESTALFGTPMELSLLELTLWRSEGPVASLQYTTLHTRVVLMISRFHINLKSNLNHPKQVRFSCQDSCECNFQTRGFFWLPPKKHQPQPPFNMSFRGKTLATSTNSTIPPYPCNRNIPPKKPSLPKGDLQPLLEDGTWNALIGAKKHWNKQELTWDNTEGSPGTWFCWPSLGWLSKTELHHGQAVKTSRVSQPRSWKGWLFFSCQKMLLWFWGWPERLQKHNFFLWF